MDLHLKIESYGYAHTIGRVFFPNEKIVKMASENEPMNEVSAHGDNAIPFPIRSDNLTKK